MSCRSVFHGRRKPPADEGGEATEEFAAADRLIDTGGYRLVEPLLVQHKADHGFYPGEKDTPLGFVEFVF